MIAAANMIALTPPVLMLDPPAVTTLVCEGAAVSTVVGPLPEADGIVPLAWPEPVSVGGSLGQSDSDG